MAVRSFGDGVAGGGQERLDTNGCVDYSLRSTIEASGRIPHTMGITRRIGVITGLGGSPKDRGHFGEILLAGVACIVIILILYDTVTNIVQKWYSSPTYAHGFLIVPICLYLVWRQRDKLSAIE